ncbi:hypothetical protein C0Q16_29760, partial [Klebsiella pneumoniae]
AGLVKLAVVYLGRRQTRLAPAQQACYFAAGKDLSAGLVKLAVVYLGRRQTRLAPAQQACYFAAGKDL